MNSTDFNDIQVLISNINHLEEKLRYMIDDEARVRDQLDINAKVLLDLEVKSALKKLDIEEINRDKLGIRVSALRAANFNNIYQLVNTSLENITNIHGIGSESARQIYKTARKIENETKRTTVIRFIKNNNESNRLAISIFQFMNLKSIYINSENLYNQEHESIQRAILYLNQNVSRNMFSSFSSLSNLMRGDDRKSAINEYTTYLRSLLNGTYKELVKQYEHKFNEIKAIPIETISADLNANSLQYYQVLNIFMPGRVGNLTPPKETVSQKATTVKEKKEEKKEEKKVVNSTTKKPEKVVKEEPKVIYKEVIKEVPKETVKVVEKVVEKVVKDTSLDPIFMTVYTIYNNISPLSKLNMLVEGNRDPYNKMASNILDDNESVEERSEYIAQLYNEKMINQSDFAFLNKYITKPKPTKKVEVSTDLEVVDSDFFIANLVDTVYIKQTAITSTPEKFTLYFIDEDDNKISNEHILETTHQDINETYKFRFEFDKQSYNSKKKYYLLILDAGMNELKRISYRLDIAFSDDFDF